MMLLLRQCTSTPLQSPFGKHLRSVQSRIRVSTRQPHIVASSSTPPYPDELAAASARVRDGLSAVQGAASAALGDASVAFSSALTKARDAKLETRNLVKWNFGVQAFLAAVSWAVVFTTTHADLMRGGVKGFPQLPTVLLLVGVVLSGVSAFWSFTYLRKVESSGESVLDGFAQLKNYFDHAQVNFLGAAATIIALQAEVGTMFAAALTSGAKAAAPTALNTSVAAMAQAATNTLAAHLVSIVFLFFLIKKTSGAYEDLVAWSNQLRATLPPLK